jgi:allantoinase
MTAYTKLVEKDKSMKGLAAYSASRPPHSEGLAVFIASYLAHEAALPNINLLHLSSRKAVQAALMMAEVFPHIDFRREVTIGHLMLDITSKAAELAKVNPPIRPREDVEFLWQALLAGDLDWVVSDHACCRHEMKIPAKYFGNIWMAKSGFGGTEYLLPALVSEGSRRGMGYNHMARVTSWNPAQRFEGFDADIAIVDPACTWTIRAKDSPSTQGYTPFEGLEMSARVDATFLRGMKVFEDGQVIGKPRGQYLQRPTA